MKRDKSLGGWRERVERRTIGLEHSSKPIASLK